MGFEDLFDFDEASYKEKVKDLSFGELISRVGEKNAEIQRGNEHEFTGGLLAFATGGISLLETAYGCRKIEVASRSST
jgi:hypothetical protein